MTIVVNDKKIDYTIENEKKLGDIIPALKSWLVENGNVINTIAIDDRVIENIGDKNDMELDISAVNTIKITTSNMLELGLDSLETIKEYCEHLQSLFTGDVLKNNDLILDGLLLIDEGLSKILKILRVSDYMVVKGNILLHEIRMQLKKFLNEYEKKYIDEPGVARLQEILHCTKALLPKLYKWGVFKNSFKLLDSENLRKEFIPYLHELIEDISFVCMNSLDKFEAVGKDLQVGDDIPALNGISYISEVLGEVIESIRLVEYLAHPDFKKIVVGQDDLERIFTRINDFLRVVEKAFHEHDMITIADVIEFELMPLFERVIQIMLKINVIID